MKKLLAFLATASLITSSIATVGCTIGDNIKAEFEDLIQRVIETTAFQSKAAVIRSEEKISAKYLLDTWGNDKVSDHFEKGHVNSIGGQDVLVKSLFKSLFGDEKYTINNLSEDPPKNPAEPRIKKDVNENIAIDSNFGQDETKTPMTPTSSFIGSVEKLNFLFNFITKQGIPLSLGQTLVSLLDSGAPSLASILGSLGGSDGILAKIAGFLTGNNADLLISLEASMNWKGLENKDLTFDGAFKIVHKQLAEGLNKVFKHTPKPEDVSIVDTITFVLPSLINKLINKDKKDAESAKFDLMAIVKDVLPALINWFKVLTVYVDQYQEALSYSPTSVDHIFSASETNSEFKIKMDNASFWDNQNVIDNTVNISNLFEMLTKFFTLSTTDPYGYDLQKIVYMLIGEGVAKPVIYGKIEDETKPHFSPNSGQLFSEVLYGVYDSIVPVLKSLLDLGSIGNLLGKTTTETETKAFGALLRPLLEPIKKILGEISNDLANNHEMNFFTNLGELLIKFSADNLLPGLIFTALKLTPKQQEEMIIFLTAAGNKMKERDFSENFDHILGTLQTGKNNKNIWGKITNIISQLKDIEGWGDFSSILKETFGINLEETLDGLIAKVTPIFDKIQNVSNITTLPIKDLLDSFGINALNDDGQLARLLYTIKNYSLFDIVQYINRYLKDSDQDYKLHFNNLAYVVRVLANKVSLDDEEMNIFTALQKVIDNKDDYKNKIKKIRFIGKGWDGESIPADKSYDINEIQTAFLTLMGIEISHGIGVLINGGLFSAVSSLLGPSTDWVDARAPESVVKGVADHSKFFTQIITLFVNTVGKLSASNNAWIKDKLEPKYEPSVWDYKTVSADIGHDARSEAIIKYQLTWKYKKIKTYTVTVKREASYSMFDDMKPWKITSIYDDSKPISE